MQPLGGTFFKFMITNIYMLREIETRHANHFLSRCLPKDLNPGNFFIVAGWDFILLGQLKIFLNPYMMEMNSLIKGIPKVKSNIPLRAE